MSKSTKTSKLVITYGHVQAHIHKNSFVFSMTLWTKLNKEIHLVLLFLKNFNFHDVSQFCELQMIFLTFLEVLIESLKQPFQLMHQRKNRQILHFKIGPMRYTMHTQTKRSPWFMNLDFDTRFQTLKTIHIIYTKSNVYCYKI